MSIQNLSNKTLRGYISSRDINGSFYPQSLQNLLIRNFSVDNNINLQLSGTEWNIKKSYLMLRSIINQRNDGIIFFSLLQLTDNDNKFKYFVRKIVKKKKIIVFCLENIFIRNEKDLKKIINLIKYNKFSKSKDIFNFFKKNFKSSEIN